MLVKNWMSKDVIFIDENDTMDTATRLLKEHGITLLPVMKNNRLKGVVTDRDLKRASASDATSLEIHELLYLLTKIKLESIMSAPAITVPPDFTIEETAELLLANRISGVPVVDESRTVVGVITKTDIFKALISLTGFGARGVQFAFQLQDRSGSIKEVTDIIRAAGGRLAGILTSYDRAPEGYRNVYVRVFGLDRTRINAMMDSLEERAALLYMVDHRENRREIFVEN